MSERTTTGPTLAEYAEANGIALFTMANALPDDGSAPEWVTVFPRTGRVETRDGRAYDVSAATLMGAYREDGIKIPVDVNHSTDAAGLFGSPAPAVGWGTALRQHDGGLQLKVDWLDEGRALLKARQYLYTSPSFYQDDGQATRLKALALVTSPALARQPALARAGGPVKGTLKAMATALGLSETATEAECLAAVTNLQGGNHQTAVETLIGEALQAMKITPAEREGYTSLCATPAGLRQVAKLFAMKAPLRQPSALEGRPVPDGMSGNETATQLAARATRYRDEQTRIGNPISQADAIVHCAANPTR